MSVEILGLMIGKIKPFGLKGEPSAFLKTAINHEVEVESLGITGDQQADLKHHGGVDKAIMHYALDHYAPWLEEKPELGPMLVEAGAFGENISTLGLTEINVCIGDRYRLGSALVEVSQARQPCWKINRRFNNKTMLVRVTEAVRCGWYYRVLEPGTVKQGDQVQLLDCPYPQWTVEKVFGLLVGKDKDLAAMAELKSLTVLSEAWRERASRRHHMLR